MGNLYQKCLMPIFDALLVGSLSLLLFLGLFNFGRRKQIQQELDEAFYQLLESEDNQVSLIQLAVRARVDATVAREYLERQATAFGATLEVDADGDTFYRFPKLHRKS
ncbi:MAG: hypothetical protein F6J93_15855 [Oscillatoria sp. SIO1A7]|nr:hypothetical protein [Oscillatoria sp. SIO1A7]